MLMKNQPFASGRKFIFGHAFAFFLLAAAGSAGAATTWTGAVDGNWDLSTANWTGGTGSVWTNGDAGVFGTGPVNKTIVVGSGISASTLAINASGYSLSGGGLTLTGTGGGNLSVAAGVSTTINSVLTLPTTGGSISVGAGSVLNLGATGSSVIRDFSGTGTTNITAGTYTMTSHADMTGSVVVSGGGTLATGGAATLGVAVNGVGSLTIDNGGTLNTTGSSATTALNIGFGGASATPANGTVTLKTGGTMTLGNKAIIIGKAGSFGSQLLDIQGGTLNSGEVIFFGENAASTGSNTLNISGGTTTVKGLVVRNTAPTTGTSTNTFTMTGGTLYLGVNGISLSGTPVVPTITLSGGTIGAAIVGTAVTGNWSSSLAMTLGTTNGNITFKTTDAVGTTAYTIGLSGVLSGAGGLTKAGVGTLNLTGANTFSGLALVNAGTLATGSSGTFGAGNVTVASSATLTLGNFTSINDLGTLTFSESSQVNLNFSGTAETVYALFDSSTNSYIPANTYTASTLNALLGGSATTFAGTGSITVLSSVPEPQTWGLMVSAGLVTVVFLRRRRMA